MIVDTYFAGPIDMSSVTPMNMILFLGFFMILVGIVQALDVARRKGEAFEYASAMFIGEFGLMFVANRLVPAGPLQICVTIAFGISMFWTFTIWRKLFHRYKRSRVGDTTASHSA